MSPMSPDPLLMDVTLRDGSYAIGFRFTEADTRKLASELDDAGVPLIEVGHGIGLGASREGMGRAAATDEAYARAASEAVTDNSWGMFCIPGIARLEDVDMVAGYGIDFLRVGANVTEVEQMEPYIRRARSHGIYVTANLMKSYAVTCEEFSRLAKRVHEYGAECLYVVDSAGGMLPSDVKRYFDAVQYTTEIPAAFHGHDNLGLGVANALKAVELGAVIVDASLQGLGRSAGNTPTELLLLAAKREGVNLGCDHLKLLDISEKYVRPLLRENGISSIDAISGYAQFHSSYMDTIHEYAGQYGVDPRRLILAVASEDQVYAKPEVVKLCAHQLSDEAGGTWTAGFRMDTYHGSEERYVSENLIAEEAA